MTQALTPKLDDVANLLLLAEEASQELARLTWYLIGRDPLTGPLLADLQLLARDAQIKIGSRHWACSALHLNREVNLLLTADGRTWKRAHDLLDPERYRGVDYAGLIAVLDSRISHFRGNSTRMRQIMKRLIREEGE